MPSTNKNTNAFVKTLQRGIGMSEEEKCQASDKPLLTSENPFMFKDVLVKYKDKADKAPGHTPSRAASDGDP